MPETLDTLGEKIAALTTSFGEVRKQLDGHDKRFDQIDRRFEQVDKQFEQVYQRFADVDKRINGTGSTLRTLIEAVDSKVGLVLEKVTHLMERDIHNSVAHARFETRLDDHELRLLALETGGRGGQASPGQDDGERQ